jgi:general L-amino acid transport system permease protein
MSADFEPIAQRSPPVRQSGFVPWIRANLFADWKSSVATIAVIALAVIYLPGLAEWAIFAR